VRYNGSFWTGIVRPWQNGIIFSEDIQGTVGAVTGIDATNVWFLASGSVHPISFRVQRRSQHLADLARHGAGRVS